jgi:hypothetical protein
LDLRGKTPEGKYAWYVQYRQVSAKGVLWHLVNEASKQPMCYTGATEALKAATFAGESDRPPHR